MGTKAEANCRRAGADNRVFGCVGACDVFTRKLDSHYLNKDRPPLAEAFFLTRMPDGHQANLIDNDCPTPLIFAHLLLAEFYLFSPPWKNMEEGMGHYGRALDLLKETSPMQQHLMAMKPSAWPLRAAIKQVQRAHAEAEEAFEQAVHVGNRVDFVVAHCRESLDWILDGLGQ
eukprot:4540858-Amphidinium_carterae.1